MDDETKSGWEYKPDGGGPPDESSGDPVSGNPGGPRNGTISWEAPEYIEHHHGFSWYLSLVIVTLLLAVAVYMLSGRDLIAAVIILILGGVVGVFANHKPATVKYELNSTGLIIDTKAYRHSDYKSFSILREGVLSSVNLLPLKRFMPPLAAYFDPADEVKIVKALGDNLPYEDRPLDAVDRLSRRLRF